MNPETNSEANAEPDQPESTLQPGNQPETSAVRAPRARAASPALPSADQLLASRGAHWHQAANALLSLDTLRAWLQQSGLVLYTPKPQLGAPAPSLVEATLGKPQPTPELADLDTARSLMTRLIAEGNAVPLNLLGVTGGVRTDQPDFVVSAGVFSYIFTLRGNKAWKLAPVTSGPVKVSPLALAAYEILSAKVTLTAYDLTTQLGKEVTEAAVLRALTELWSQLRVIPVPQPDGSATLWELSTARFTKQIKAGANAGQPSALSALISLYLGQAIIASEAEVESFLSPLAPRSRVRDVLHALLSARQLETVVIDGRTLLHVAGDLPAFTATTAPEASETGEAEAADGSRISKFAAKPGSKIGTGLRSKPSFGAKPAFGKRPYGGKPAFGRAEGGDRERRPFKRDSKPAYDKPAYDKPWQENRPAPAAASSEIEEGDFQSAPRAFDRRPAGDRPSFSKRPSFGARGNGQGDSRPPRGEYKPREFTPREGAGDGPRKTFSKPGTFGRKREGGFSARPAARGEEGRPPRRDFAGTGERPAHAGWAERPERSERQAAGGFKRPGSYSPRPSGGGSFGGPRRESGSKPGFSQDRPGRPDGSGAPGEAGAEGPRKVFRKFDAPRGPKPSGSKPSFGGKSAGRPTFGSKPAFGDRAPRPAYNSDRPARPVRDFDGPRPERSGSSDRPRSESRSGSGAKPSFGAKPGLGAKPGGFAGKKPFSTSGSQSGPRPGGRPTSSFAAAGGPFAKFADGKKPFRKPGAPRGTSDRTSSPRGNDSSRRGPGGFAPTRRQRPE